MKPSTNRNSYGFVRFTLASAVVYTHACYLTGRDYDPLTFLTRDSLSMGSLAVGFFFALSGMLIAPSFERCGSIFVYTWHRVLRIYPLLIAAIFLSATIVCYLARLPLDNGGHPPLWSGTQFDYFWRNIWIPGSFAQIPGVFDTNPVSNFINGSLWSLRYELSSYVIIGVAGILGGLGRRRGWLIGLFLGLYFVHVHDQFFAENTSKWFFRSEGKRMILIAIGGAVWASLSSSLRQLLLQRGWIVGFSIATAAGAVCGLPWLLAPLTFAPLLHAMGHKLNLPNWERQVGGDYSYGIYVVHYPIEQLLLAWGALKWNFGVFLIVAYVLSLGVARLSWRYVEAPSMRAKSWRPSWVRRRDSN